MNVDKNIASAEADVPRITKVGSNLGKCIQPTLIAVHKIKIDRMQVDKAHASGKMRDTISHTLFGTRLSFLSPAFFQKRSDVSND